MTRWLEVHGLNVARETQKVLAYKCSYRNFENICKGTKEDYYAIALISFKILPKGTVYTVREIRYK